MSRVLVTGATGFIGRGTLGPLLGTGMEVHAVTSGPLERVASRPEAVNWHQADLLSQGAVEPLVERIAPSHLLHLAWYAEPRAFWRSTENLRWVEASLRLMRAFARHGGRRAALAGSCAEYDWERRTRCVEGKTPCRPTTLYGASKHGLRLIAERFAEEVGISLAWGRVFFVFGPHEDPRRLAGSVAQALVLGEEASCSHGEQLRDFLYSEDLAAAFVALLLSDVEAPVNLASGLPIRVRDLVDALAVAAGRRDLVRLGARPAAAGEPDELVADVTRLHTEVGWKPPATLEQRATDTVRWWVDALTAGRLHRDVG
jgi:nucleoside-diphosphate-sugar epimerase